MNPPLYILAQGDEGLFEIIIIGAIFLLGIIGSVFQKAKEKAQQREAREKRRRPTPEGAPSQQAPRPQPAAQQRRKQVQPRRPARAQTQEPVRVSEELRRAERRQKKLEEERRQRLATHRPPEADTAAIEAKLLHVPKAGEDGYGADAAGKFIGGLGLLTPAEARRAIVLHEILSPPKSLRQGGESWDV